jgi:predicted Zn-dependent peptidase
MNASTDKEVTMYWTRVPSDKLELAIDVLADMVTESKLEPADVDKERQVILEELKMYQDQPQDYVHSLFEQVMWPNHPLGRDIGGTLESVAALSREDLFGHLRGHYQPQRLVAGVSGGIDPDLALRLLDNRLTLGSGEEASTAAAALPEVTESTLLLLNKKTEQAHICLGLPAFSYLDPDRHALDLINTILGEGMSSRLFLEIREKRGLAYDVHSYTSKHRDTGYLAVYVGVDPKKGPEAVSAVVAELRRLVTEEVGPEELTKVKEFTKGRLRLGLESTNAVASWLTQQQLLMGSIRTQEMIIEAVDAISAEDIQRVADRVLSGPIQMSVIGPFASEKKLKAAIS